MLHEHQSPFAGIHCDTEAVFADLAGPPALVPFRSAPLRLGPGEQADFVVEPPATRAYRVGTFGDSDTVVVIFEERDGEPRYPPLAPCSILQSGGIGHPRPGGP
jgi:hypothetical protein